MTNKGSSTTLLIFCLVYTIAAADEYWVLDWLRELYGIKLAVFAALLQNASWPVQIFYYLNARKQHLAETGSERQVTKSMYKSYIILGILSAFITLSRTVGITSLPASIYVICANTEIVFETIMTKVILRREVSYLQLASVVFVLAGVSISLYDPKKGRYGDGQGVSQTQLLTGVFMSLLSRLASSLNTILADRFLGKDAKSRMGVLECSLANSLIPCLVLPLVLLVIPEYQKWPDQLYHHPQNIRLFIGFLCLVVTASKHADRLAKFSIVSMTSTMFFAAVDSNMKVVAGIGSFLFFRDDVYWPQILGFILIFIALIIMYIDKKQKSLATANPATATAIASSTTGDRKSTSIDRTFLNIVGLSNHQYSPLLNETILNSPLIAGHDEEGNDLQEETEDEAYDRDATDLRLSICST